MSKGQRRPFQRIITGIKPEIRAYSKFDFKALAGNRHEEFLTWKGSLLSRHVKASLRYESQQRLHRHCVL